MVNSTTGIIFSIVLLFVSLGVFLPIIQEGFGETVSDPDENSLIDDIDEDDVGLTGVGDILLSVFKMFTWTFGDIPWFIDAIIFLPLRILLAVIIARSFLFGGGG